MLVRKLAAVAIAAGVLVSATGCSFNPHPETLQSYAPSDGSGIDIYPAEHNEHVALRNFLILTDGAGNSNLFGTIVNSGATSQTLTLKDAAGTSQEVVVGPGEAPKFGIDGFGSSLNFEGKAGDLVALQVTADGGKTWQTIQVPILDGTIDYYKDLVGKLAPTETPVATPSPTASN